jgi:hypothetical protein
MVEHVAYHDHAALRPLTHAAELRMLELRHGTVTSHQGAKQRQNSVRTDTVPLSDSGGDVLTFRGEFMHAGTCPTSNGGKDEQAAPPERICT